MKNVWFLRGLNCLVSIFFLKKKAYWVFFIIKAIHIDLRIVENIESKRRIESPHRLQPKDNHCRHLIYLLLAFLLHVLFWSVYLDDTWDIIFFKLYIRLCLRADSK